MKTLILGCLIAISGIVSAQNYRLIPSGVNCYINSAGYIKAIRLDSGVVAGTDSLYHNFLIISADTSCPLSGCSESFLAKGYSIHKPSWIGNGYGVRNNGEQYLLDTLHNDTILFRTQAQVNQFWRLYTYPDSTYLEAKVTQLISDSVLGTTDSVKYISLTTKDSSGLIVAGKFNGIVLRLSQNHGLLTFLNFESVPIDTAILTATEARPLTRRQVYDFKVGDTIQYREYCNLGPPYAFDHIITLKCLSKNLLGTTGVEYSFEQITYDFDGPSVYKETITRSYGLLDSFVYNAMPEEGFEVPYLNQYFMYRRPAYIGGRTYMTDNGSFMVEDSMNGHCHYSICAYDLPYQENIYADGLGSLQIDGAGPSGGTFRYFTYFKKGIDQWGSSFTGINEVAANTLQLSLSPNPANDRVDFHFNTTIGLSISIQISDIAGRQLLNQENAAANNISINTASLSNGLYLYHIKCGDKYATGKLVIAR